MITVKELLEALQKTSDAPPLKCAVVTARIMDLQGGTDDQPPLTPEILLEMGPEIEAALHQANLIAFSSKKILAQVLKALPPAAHPRVPLGF